MLSRKEIVIYAFLAALSLSGYLWVSAVQEGPGFPLDDAWIHQTYARNLAKFGEWSFVAGEPSAGSTAPLWSVLLSLGHLIGEQPFLWTYLLGGSILWGFGVLAHWGIKNTIPDRPLWSWFAGVFFLFEWHLVWAAASGMETALFALLVFAVLLIPIVVSGRQTAPLRLGLLLGILIGTSVWVRPEGITLLAPILLWAFLLRARKTHRVGQLVVVMLGFLLLFGPYLFFNRHIAGEWWPNTFYAKQAEYAILREAPITGRMLQQFLRPLVGSGFPLLPGFVGALWSTARRRDWGLLLPAAWIFGHLGLYAWRLPVVYQHGRYAMPAMPVYFLIGIIGMVHAAKLSNPQFLKRIISRVWVTTTGAVLIAFWIVGTNVYADDVTIIQTEMVGTAKWIAHNIPPDEVLAAHDIGALGYFAPRPILDLAGLVSPDVIPFIRDEAQLAAYIDNQNGKYIMTLPGWYPRLISGQAQIYQSRGQVSYDLGGENMAVYRWESP